jgi:glycosyltransferase involved in cell wall biosynthesis
MNILHTDFHRGWGGQAARVLMVCRQLADRGHRAMIVAPPGELTRRAREAGIPVEDRFAFRPPSHALTFAADVRRLARLLREGSFDILHTHGSQDTWVGAATRSFTGRPSIFLATRHNTKRVRFNVANRWLYGRALDHLVLVSESIRRQFRPFLEAGLLGEERISVVHSAYRIEEFGDGVDSGPLRRELGLEGPGPLLGVMARLARDKGHTFLFQAMGEIRRRHRSALLLVAGLGPHEEALRREAKERGLEDAVRFLGFRDDIPALTALVDVAVLPSVGCDASSASIKEAMAMGKPVVASDIGGAREILQDGVTGRVVAPGDPGALARAILALLDDPESARSMGEKAKAEVRERFSPDHMGRQAVAVYEKLMERVAAAGSPARPAAVGHPGSRS